MPTRKISDLPEFGRPCHDPDHGIPNHAVFNPGIYEHTCPSCGEKKQFIVPVRYTHDAFMGQQQVRSSSR